jgi:hypothetical protein
VATFTPSSALLSNLPYTATITTGAQDLASNALAVAKVWTFTTIDNVAPTVGSVTPVNSATSVALGTTVTATFSEAMKAASITGTTFTLAQGVTPVTGTVTYSGLVATFTPSSALLSNLPYTATITTGAQDLASNALALAKVWTFTTLDNVAPTVSSVVPSDTATGVAVNTDLSVTFSEAMDQTTLTAATFTLNPGSLPGALSWTGNTVTFNPTADLAGSTTYTATITTGAKDLAGNALATNKVWTFTTVAVAPLGPAAPNLASAAGFAVIGKTLIDSTPGASSITGDLAMSPAAATFITGFALVADASNIFSTSSQVVTGSKVYAADYVNGTTHADLAVFDMMAAYTSTANAASPTPTVGLGGGTLGGNTLVPGIYNWGTGLSVATSITLNGGANDVWIFQVGTNMTVASAQSILLTGGAQAKNVFWQVAGNVVLDTTSHMEGTILCQTYIHALTGATVNGRLLAQTEVTLDHVTVIVPAP